MTKKRKWYPVSKRLAAAEDTLMAIASYGAMVNDEPESRACARNWLDKYASRSTRKEIAAALKRDALSPIPSEKSREYQSFDQSAENVRALENLVHERRKNIQFAMDRLEGMPQIREDDET